ncbi:elongin-A isoform X2 [Betta splendens]|nr:elongin-A isoform X2 [Betta splendens]
MTVDLLVETGVGKTVNSFRKHEIVGEIAKSLVAKWKKLVPQSADRPNSYASQASQSNTQSRGLEAGGGGGHRRTREPSPEEEPSYMEEEEEEEEEQQERSYHTNYSPSPPPPEQYSPPQRGRYQSDEYNSPEPEPSPPPPPPRKEVRPAKANKEPKNHHHHTDRNRDRGEERRKRHAQTSSDRGGGGGGGGGSSSEGKKHSADRERQQSPVQKPPKHNKRDDRKKGGEDGRPRAQRDSPFEDEDFEAPTMSFESFLTYDAPTPAKKKKKPASAASASAPSSSHSRPSSSTRRARTPPPPTAPSSSSSSKASKTNGTQGTKRSHSSSSSSAAATSEKRKRIVEAVPTLPEIPLPAIQPNYRPLPSIDVTPLSPQRRKVPVCNDEEDEGFTGRRLNSKMVVYSGSKTSYLPKMMTLYDQCIRVLQNNIDSIAEVGGVPYEILEPVLKRCTPEQLYRIEQSNQCFTEDSDELWMHHCQRDFKRESPQEYESWRELYLRLHDEREERLRMLTQNITSAHANKPKGRQVKMAYVNSAAKPPRDVRRRQEKFGTTSGLSTAASTSAATPIKIRPVTTDDQGESSRSFSQNNPSSSSIRSSAPGGAPAAGPGGHGARDKPQVKKIAPMMAKTIKAFRNRFSRR